MLQNVDGLCSLCLYCFSSCRTLMIDLQNQNPKQNSLDRFIEALIANVQEIEEIAGS